MSSNGRLQARDKENVPPPATRTSDDTIILGTKRKADRDILSSGPKKRPARTDPLIHYGRHFGRTLQAFCRIHALIKQGLAIAIQIDMEETPEESLTADEYREYQIYKQLLMLSPRLEERLFTGSEQDLYHVADMLSKGSANARADDTRALKSAVIDWITPPGGVLVPPLQRNIKTDRGFHHDRTGQLLCPATLDWTDVNIREKLRAGQITPTGDQWSLFLFQNHKYDPQDPWNGLLRGPLLVKGFKYVFTSPSSVERTSDHRATRCSNSKIHGMSSVTIPLCKIRFSLSSTAVFSRSDFITDSEGFYSSLVTFLQEPEEHFEVKKLLAWWDKYAWI
ncbi:hypothetical protein BKA70DRAFT_1377253 [Coprinopsis sp. MPI-PUGE-AT-0042]|nr:hypothetical protein BKA70DRAFT_1377253 [Coprinopsis sp. MPI-PUGE-AT-0042]